MPFNNSNDNTLANDSAQHKAKPARRSLLLLALSTLTLNACGFSLRRNTLPAWYANKTLKADFAPKSVLGTQFIQAYIASGGKLATPNSKPDLVLRILSENKKRVPLSTTVGGLVREYRLDLSLTVELLDAQGKTLMPSNTFTQQHLFSFTESDALAKEYENKQNYLEMGKNLVRNLLSRLSALSP